MTLLERPHPRVRAEREAPPPAPRGDGIFDRASRASAQIVDRAVWLFSPRTAAKRHRARAASLRAGWNEGARDSRMHPDWTDETLSADGEILDDLPRLRSRSRQLAANDGHAGGLFDQRVDNVIGPTGLRLQARATPEETGLTSEQCGEWNKACERVWRHWAEHECDATEIGTFADLQRLAYLEWRRDGEAFAHVVKVVEEGRRSKLALEMIAPERVVNPDGSVTGMVKVGDARVHAGVELGPKGQPVAYHVRRFHPDDPLESSDDTQRFRRKRNGLPNVLHLYTRHRVGQTRGVPLLRPVLAMFDSLRLYMQSELAAARVASCIALFIRRNIADDPSSVWDTQEQHYVESLAPAMVEYLGEGEEPVTFAPQRPGTTFEPFVVRLLRAIGAGTGVPYELLVRDFTKTNYTSMRAELLEVRRSFRCDQGVFVRMFCQPIYKLRMREAYLAGELPRVQNFDAIWPELMRTRWIPPAWGWVDPVKEIQASVAAIDAGLSTASDEAANAGQDFEEVARARAMELQVLRALEEEFDLPPGSLGQKAPPPEVGQQDDDEGEEEDVDDEESETDRGANEDDDEEG